MRIYDNFDLEYKRPFGAVRTNEAVNFTIRLPKVYMTEGQFLVIFEIDHPESRVEVPMDFSKATFSDNLFSCEFAIAKPGVYLYYFEFFSDGLILRVKRGDNNSGVICEDGGDWQLTVYDEKMRAPAFLREGVLYQIFPDRFAKSGAPKRDVPADRILREDWGGLPFWRPDSDGEVKNNDYFGGDLKGIEQKLDYLKSLGVTALYLNPIFEAHSNHRYNTADYSKIDPLLGTYDDFKSLAETAEQKGISIILDGVFSHTGSDSVYFNKGGRYGDSGAYRDPESPYRQWYGFERYPDKYDSWWGFLTLPNVRETDPGYMEYICGDNGILEKWLKAGAAGFRLDVADELPDEFLEALYKKVKCFNPDCAVIGEVWEDASTKTSYGIRRKYLIGKQLDSVMNYPFKEAILNYIRRGWGDVFLNTVMQILENYPKPAIQALMNSISTHDTERAITALGAPPIDGHDREWQERHHHLSAEDYELGCKRFKLASILQFGLPGIPCVYYGDEAGAYGYRDPFNRCCYPWGGENRELVEFIASLGMVRKDYPVFAEADFIPITFNRDICSFARTLGETAIVFAVNRGKTVRRLALPHEYANSEALVAAGEYSGGALGPHSGVVLLVTPDQADTKSQC